MNAKKLRDMREKKGFSQTELARLVKMDRSYLNKMENGKLTPSVSLLGKIAKVLDCSIRDFF